MDPKCDVGLLWWFGIANLYRREHKRHQRDGEPTASPAGFGDLVRGLEGQAPVAVEMLLRPLATAEYLFAGLVKDADGCLWRLAGVAESILSHLAERHASPKPELPITVADWSDFPVPINLEIAGDGEVARAYRPDPLADGLLVLIRGKNVASFGLCPVCDQLFERRRRDQLCDRRTCRDTERQRRFRRKVRNHYPDFLEQ
jgi:hypothetical protein